ncbi:epimerase [Lunatimonas salinarum]|uniref:epimerase n=1 Tax=Lunatimonas salinarum TaxID=1774590 RepID=UPI001ADFE04A|nr:epimerase [Lunatimonas salinarum]
MDISILGLGWIGEPLYMSLRKNGHAVIGSTTNREKWLEFRNRGVDACLFELGPEPKGEGYERLFDTDILYINIPPSRRTKPDSFHIDQIKHVNILAKQGDTKRVIYVSATSVYPNRNQVAMEEDPLTESTTANPALFHAEQILRKQWGDQLTIIRFGGLLGDNRVPGRYFSGKSGVVGHAPANYVYRFDAVRAVEWVISKGLWGEVFNVVAPEHPVKSAVYESNAASLGFDPPASYAPPDESWKEISPQKIMVSGFRFEYPNPLSFPYLR